MSINELATERRLYLEVLKYSREHYGHLFIIYLFIYLFTLAVF